MSVKTIYSNLPFGGRFMSPDEIYRNSPRGQAQAASGLDPVVQHEQQVQTLESIREATRQNKIRTKALEDEAFHRNRATEDAETARRVKGWEDADKRRMEAIESAPRRTYSLPGREDSSAGKEVAEKGYYSTLRTPTTGADAYEVPSGPSERTFTNVGVQETRGPSIAEERATTAANVTAQRSLRTEMQKERIKGLMKSREEAIKSFNLDQVREIDKQIAQLMGEDKQPSAVDATAAVRSHYAGLPPEQKEAFKAQVRKQLGSNPPITKQMEWEQLFGEKWSGGDSGGGGTPSAQEPVDYGPLQSTVESYRKPGLLDLLKRAVSLPVAETYSGFEGPSDVYHQPSYIPASPERPAEQPSASLWELVRRSMGRGGLNRAQEQFNRDVATRIYSR